MRTRTVLSWVAGLLLAVEAVGLPLIVLENPGLTHALVDRYAHVQESGLARDRVLEVAEGVRAFVVRGTGVLPARVDGRDAFDAEAVSHLVDVRQVLRGAHLAVGLIAATLAAWLCWSVCGRRLNDVAHALGIGAATVAGTAVLATAVATADFDAFFSAFHGLFFASGTWTFPYDSLLIQVFPEPFWSALGLLWAVLAGMLAVVYGISAWLLRRNAFSQKA